MGRTTESCENWFLAQNKQSKELVVFLPTVQPSCTKKREFTQIGIFYKKEDAEMYAAFKELGLRPDQVAFLKLEHEFTGNPSIEKDEIENIEEQVQLVRVKTGRTCFGHCRCMSDSCQSCQTCYSSLNPTWTQCAKISILVSNKR